LLDNSRLIWFDRYLGEFAMKVWFVLNVVYFINKLELHLVVDVQLLVPLADLHLQVVVRLLNLSDVHFLQLKMQFITPVLLP